MIYSENKKYYEVECKCGHTGSKRFYIPVKFAVAALNGKDAAEKGRMIPRCKHNHKDCVLSVREISYEQFINLNKINKEDPFLNCHSIQEQSKYDLSDRLVIDPHYSELHPTKKERENQIHPVCKGKTQIRNPKRYFKLYSDYEMEACY